MPQLLILTKMADISEDAYGIFLKIKKLQDLGSITLTEEQSVEINKWIKDFSILFVQEQVVTSKPSFH